MRLKIILIKVSFHKLKKGGEIVKKDSGKEKEKEEEIKDAAGRVIIASLNVAIAALESLK